MSIRMYDAIYSLQRFFDDNLGVRADWVSDGYKHPTARPYITIETLTDERITLSKQRESVQIIEHLQLGYHAINIVDRTDMAEEISDLLTFEDVPYYDTQKSLEEPVGFFVVGVTSVVPMPADELTKQSGYHRVYFDIEIEKIKRRWV